MMNMGQMKNMLSARHMGAVGLALGIWAAVALAQPVAPMPSTAAMTYGFDKDLSGWSADSDTVSAKVVPGDDARRGQVAQIQMKGTTGTLRFRKTSEAKPTDATPIDASRYRAIRFDVLLPKVMPEMHVMVYFVDEHDFWYQTWQRVTPAKGKWETVEINLRANAAQFEPIGHSRPWGPYVARAVHEFGIKICSDREVNATIDLDNIVLVPGAAALGAQDVFNFETSGKEVPQYGRFEVAFELARAYDNPFDPRQIDVRAEIQTPGGRKVTVPAFFFQDYERRVERKREMLIPAGSPKWKLRYAPRELGEYTYEIVITDHETVRLPARSFTAVASKNPGFVRVAADNRHFEFDDGSFFYPIGHNIPAPYNAKGAVELGLATDREVYAEQHKYDGTLAYDRFIEGMARGKENYARIWLACWSFAVEWNKSYERSYVGLGRYNQENAWRLDYVLDKCQENGIYVQLAMTTFGHFRTGKGREEEGDWEYSPYNRRNGGFLDSPQQFWTDEKSQALYARMLRYVAARWGYASNIAAWEICNEANLVTGFNNLKPAMNEWHKNCVKTLRQYDPNERLTTTSFSQGGDFSIYALPDISFTSTHYYAVQIPTVMRNTVYPAKSAFNKPAIMGECGYDYRGARPETTERYLHVCLWSTCMTPFGGAGLSWWWDFIEDKDLYDRFRPIAEYMAGEDRRNQKLEMAAGAQVDGKGGAVAGLVSEVLKNDHMAYFWIYERQLVRSETDPDFTPAERAEVHFELKAMRDGPYAVQFWDTRKGLVVHELTAQAKDGVLKCAVPAFTSDIAGKVKPAVAPEENPKPI